MTDLALQERLLAAANTSPERQGGTVQFSELVLADISTAELEPQRWWWGSYVPAGHVTLFGGHGGAGKSTVNLMLGACIGTGREFLGQPVERGKVLFFSAECVFQPIVDGISG